MNNNNGFPYQKLPKKLISLAFEVHQMTGAPIALIFASILGAISLACQSQILVMRPGGLLGPVSLFLITIADSGERKSTVDRLIMKILLTLDKYFGEVYWLDFADYEQALAIHTAEKKALMSRLYSERKRGLDTSESKARLMALSESEPTKPVRKRLILTDVTPASLKKTLSAPGASCGIMSDEAGIVFGSKTLEQLSLFNKLWDGDPLSIDRANAEALEISGARMTASLMAQPGVIGDFLSRGKNEARKTGYLARCLICYPESTQGTRLSGNTEASTEHLSIFHGTLEKFINMPPKDSPTVMRFIPDAKQLWLNFCDETERSIKATGYGSMAEHKDYASKMPENAARLAALLQYFCTGKDTICAGAMQCAIEIIQWYKAQYLQIIGKKNTPEDDAQELLQWLIKTHHKYNFSWITKTFIHQYGPSRMRNVNKINVLLDILHSNNLIFRATDGRTELVSVNFGFNNDPTGGYVVNSQYY